MNLYRSNGTKLQQSIAPDEIYYKSGDTININSLILNGFITSGATTVRVNLITSKSLQNIKTIECSYFYAEARGVSGYLNSNSGYYNFTNNSSYKLECTKIDNSKIRIDLIKNSSFTNVANNTPIVLQADITLKLT